ncbi:hypothetical protein BVY02_01425 [bacterium J17]|nr:hypothetical protein BVY02_01425 [bacterium J17]
MALNTSDSSVCFEIDPLLFGGPQEDRLRAGTENLLGISVFGAVAEEVLGSLEDDIERIAQLREKQKGSKKQRRI